MGGATIVALVVATVGGLAGICVMGWRSHRSGPPADNADLRLRATLSSMQEGVIVQHRVRGIVQSNDSAARILGVAPDPDGRNKTLASWKAVQEDGRELPSEEHPVAVTFRTGQPVSGEAVGIAVNGGPATWVSLSTVPLCDAAGEVEYVVATFADITEQITAAARLQWQAVHDDLTGLPNRALLTDRLQQALARAERSKASVVLLRCNLDRFRVVNDSLGHTEGDRILVEAAQRLSGVVRFGDTVARVGGDEFVILAEGLPETESVILAERMRRALAVPFDVELDRSIVITASVGVTAANGKTCSEALRDAGTALSRAKTLGRDRTERFDRTLRIEAMRRLELERHLREALDSDGLVVHYQPIWDPAAGTVQGAEALLRVTGPDGAVLAPTPYIRVAEDCGLIVPVGSAVLRQACHQLAAWQAGGGTAARVSVNVSGRQLRSPHFAGDVTATISEAGIEPSDLWLEFTEDALIDAAESTLANIRALTDIGVSVAIDDFGTGYSSLTYLKQFTVDAVKIDRSFVSGLGSNTDDTAIVSAVIGLAHALGLQVVAEGIETPVQLDLLSELGCDLVQGFLLGMPSAAADFNRQEWPAPRALSEQR